MSDQNAPMLPVDRNSEQIFTENIYIGILLSFMVVDFLAAKYISSVLYGIPIIAMQIIILKILAKRWRLEEHTDFTGWLPNNLMKRKKIDD